MRLNHRPARGGGSLCTKIDRTRDRPWFLRCPPTSRARCPYWVPVVCGLILLLVCLVFGQTLLNEFLDYDDDGFVYRNPQVTAGLTLSGFRYAMTDGPYGEWCPLTTLSHMLDCQLYGLDPTGHHLTNVLLHASSSVLLFLILLRMTRDLWPSAWVAAVFAIHPLHVESVAWLAERRDVLSGLFFMLTLGAYALYAEWPSLARYLAVAGCFALGLMSKPMLVTVPFLLLLLDYWPLGRLHKAPGTSSPASQLPVGWRLVVEKLPLLALAALSCGNRSVDSRLISLGWSSRSTAPLGPPRGQRPDCLRSLFGPVFLSRRLVSPTTPHPGTQVATLAGAPAEAARFVAGRSTRGRCMVC